MLGFRQGHGGLVQGQAPETIDVSAEEDVYSDQWAKASGRVVTMVKDVGKGCLLGRNSLTWSRKSSKHSAQL